MATQQRIRLNNQDVWIDGRWVAHISVSGKHYYGALPGKFFRGDSEMDVAQQIMVALDDTSPLGTMNGGVGLSGDKSSIGESDA